MEKSDPSHIKKPANKPMTNKVTCKKTNPATIKKRDPEMGRKTTNPAAAFKENKGAGKTAAPSKTGIPAKPGIQDKPKIPAKPRMPVKSSIPVKPAIPLKGAKNVYDPKSREIKKACAASKKWESSILWQTKILRRISKGFVLKITLKCLISAAVAVSIVLACIFGLSQRSKETALITSSQDISIVAEQNIAHITPGDPSSKDTLYVTTDYAMENVSLRYCWYKGDVEIKGAEGNSLSNSYFRKGDLIKAAITPFNDKTEGKPITSQTVKIKNSPPVIRSVDIEPKTIYTNTDIRARVDAKDHDLDSVRFQYRWIKNGSVIYAQESESLPGYEFIKGDAIQIEATPFDGEGYGKPVRSDFFIVNNSPPEIISRPPSLLDHNGAFVYQVIAKDIDNDRITFSIPPNIKIKDMKIDPSRGLLTWEIPDDIKPGDYRIEILARDNDGGEASQWFNLNIRFNQPNRKSE
ncbi:hypothetical protein JXL19_11310 [bacterium]|nr:hypothetical protein [bacterium]